VRKSAAAGATPRVAFVTQILTDDDIQRLLQARTAVSWMREALLDADAGRLASPARIHAEFGPGRLVFTAGALDGEWYGYRSYDTFPTVPGEQLVVVHDWQSGRLRGLAVGNELGPHRVGAIGGVAADELARPGAQILGLVGTGVQAWNQLWAISAVRNLAEVRVFSRDAGRRAEFADRARTELDLPCRAVDSARVAVEGADLVVLATSSGSPVIDSAWVGDGAYLTTLGPKQVGHAEFGVDLVARATLAVTDSIAQISAYDPPNILVGTPAEDRLVSLGAVVSGSAAGRTKDDDVVVFCSVGLAGTEAYLLAKLLAG
jgi:ornithine cyclodeaminase/alanine dehydrogenase-like protein (mu-crystallin family)